MRLSTRIGIILSGLIGTAAMAQGTVNLDSSRAANMAQESLRWEALRISKEDDNVRTKLSALWTVESLNMIGADVLGSFIPGTQEELEEYAGGKEEVKNYMLAGAVIYEIPISMIFLSRYLPYQVNRWTNVGAAALTALTVLGAGSHQPHYYFMAAAQTLTLSWITWTAIKWPDANAAAGKAGNEKKHDLGMNLDAPKGLYGLRYSYRF